MVLPRRTPNSNWHHGATWNCHATRLYLRTGGIHHDDSKGSRQVISRFTFIATVLIPHVERLDAESTG